MKTTVTRPVEVEISTVILDLPVRYDDEEIPFAFPGRKDKQLSMVIDIDTGRIHNWPQGREEDVHLTVKDGGTYKLYGPAANLIAMIEQDYVPHGLIPGEYGDVILFKIDGTGTITNWKVKPDVSEFFEQDDD